MFSWLRVFRRKRNEQDLDAEISVHLAMEIRQRIERGEAPDEAAANARKDFGSIALVKEATRESWGWRPLDTLALDFKLAVRILVKHPVMTLIAVVATSLAFGTSAAYFEVVNDLSYPTLPLDDGARVITIQNDDLQTASPELRSLHDFIAWRDELESVQDLGVLTIYSRNLASKNRPGEPVDVVEISAAAFRVARIAPLMGRFLDESDEQAGAPLVVVLGEHLWETRFNRDPNILGQSVELGSSPWTVIGVMPKAFALPMNQSLWVPFRMNALNYARGQGPPIRTIGRLAPGATIEEAQAELKVVGERIAAEFPETNAQLRPHIMPYLKPFSGDAGERQLKLGLNSIFMMLVALICANVGTLVFARIATRETELTVRTALGASRGRIIMQLFAEALVLTAAGAGVALALVSWGLQRAQAFVWSVGGVTPPFWWNDDLNTTTVIYIALLTMLAAVVTGVLPALKFTRGGIEANLRRSAVGGSGLRSRRMSTAVIVAQVAVSGALVPVALALTLQLTWFDSAIPGIRADEYLTARYRTEEPAAVSTQFENTYRRLKERLLAEGGFTSVTFTDQLPGTSNSGRLIELKDSSDTGIQRVRSANVDVNFFEAVSAPVLAGRGFHSGDLAPEAAVVIVNQPFVESVLGGRNPIGLQLRYTDDERDEPPSRWYEIVGVVPDLGMSPLEPAEAKGLYHPAAPAGMSAGFMAMRTGPNRETAAQSFRSIAAAVDTTLLIYDIRSLDEVSKAEHTLDRTFYLIVGMGIYFIVFLSAAVTFSLMSLTVSQRTREIGIRKALGAGTRVILTSVFSRAVVQLGLGAGLGALLSFTLFSRIPDTHMAEPRMIFIFMGFMLAVGALSCVAPVLRVLRIEPTEALRHDR